MQSIENKDLLLVVNSGSSSLKIELFDVIQEANPRSRLKFHVSNFRNNQAELHLNSFETAQRIVINVSDQVAALEYFFLELERRYLIDNYKICAIGHRVVHAGRAFSKTTLIDQSVLDKLRALAELAPLHQPIQIELIKKTLAKFSSVNHYAVFDTVFHQNMPLQAKTLPVAKELYQLGIQRYGFHGISCQYILDHMQESFGDRIMQARIIIAHLGSGSSLTAIDQLRSIDTSMSFSPNSGVMMSSRSGDLDPEILNYLLSTKGWKLDQLHKLISKRSGLLGVSNLSADVRDLLNVYSDNPDAALAIDMYCISIAKAIAGLVVTLTGLDYLVFTGGIAENSADISKKIVSKLKFLGLSLCVENYSLCGIVSSESSSAKILVIRTDEQLQIAKQIRSIEQDI